MIVLGRECWGTLQAQSYLGKCFLSFSHPGVQATTAMVQGNLANVPTGINPWCHLCSAGFAGRQNGVIRAST
jgi:hypothetical protein